MILYFTSKYNTLLKYKQNKKYGKGQFLLTNIAFSFFFFFMGSSHTNSKSFTFQYLQQITKFQCSQNYPTAAPVSYSGVFYNEHGGILILILIFIGESLFIFSVGNMFMVFMCVRFFMLFKFTCTVYKS